MTQTATSLTITREFKTSVSKLFKAWSDSKQMMQWMGPGDVSCKSVDIDFKVGGAYRIHMVGCSGTEHAGDHVAVGAYTEIIPDQKSKFTWSWESGEVKDSVVTLEFKPAGKKAKLTLTHVQFPSSEIAQKHDGGWNGCLDKLTKFLS